MKLLLRLIAIPLLFFHATAAIGSEPDPEAAPALGLDSESFQSIVDTFGFTVHPEISISYLAAGIPLGELLSALGFDPDDTWPTTNVSASALYFQWVSSEVILKVERPIHPIRKLERPSAREHLGSEFDCILIVREGFQR